MNPRFVAWLDGTNPAPGIELCGQEALFLPHSLPSVGKALSLRMVMSSED
jgi:hypothetical protein